ncbi:MAG: DUF3084 domain-containing protein [Cyanobacteria bacterium P01_H01_bin.130]
MSCNGRSMAFGYVLIVLAAVVLGGLIATVGDRLGSRVGKARLRLFKLRPRQTATVITIVTGGLISALTLGLILLLGVLELEEVQTQLRKAREELDGASMAQEEVGKSLNRLRASQRVTQGQLERSQQTLRGSQERLAEVSQQLAQASKRTATLQGDIQRLGQERRRLDQQLQRLQVDRDRKGAQIAQRESQLRTVGQRLRSAQGELQQLTAEVRSLEEEARNLRGGDVALRRGQVLTVGLVQVRSLREARQGIQRLLVVANRLAGQAIRPGVREAQVVRLSRGELEQAIAQVQDGREYVVRVLSGANYLLGEEPVRIGLEVVPNRLLFPEGERLTGSTFGVDALKRREIRDRLELLIAQAQFRVSGAGMLVDTPQVLTVDGLVRLALWLERQTEPVEIQVRAARDLETIGPLWLRFLAVRNNQILFDSASPPRPSPSPEDAPSVSSAID